MNLEGTLQMDKNWIFKILSYFISCFLDLPYLKKRKFSKEFTRGEKFYLMKETRYIA